MQNFCHSVNKQVYARHCSMPWKYSNEPKVIHSNKLADDFIHHAIQLLCITCKENKTTKITEANMYLRM